MTRIAIMEQLDGKTADWSGACQRRAALGLTAR